VVVVVVVVVVGVVVVVVVGVVVVVVGVVVVVVVGVVVVVVGVVVVVVVGVVVVVVVGVVVVVVGVVVVVVVGVVVVAVVVVSGFGHLSAGMQTNLEFLRYPLMHTQPLWHCLVHLGFGVLHDFWQCPLQLLNSSPRGHTGAGGGVGGGISHLGAHAGTVSISNLNITLIGLQLEHALHPALEALVGSLRAE
jgi:hypothetical protein